MKQIAVISDIHANAHALNAFMNYINHEYEVSQVLNLGDFIQIGPNPREVFDTVMSDDRFIHIMGNSEAMFFDETLLKRYEHEKAHQDWVADQLGPERMNRLKDLPLQRIVQIENVRFLMVHARMEFPADQPLLYQQRPFEEFIADYPADSDYVLIGHTHLPLHAVFWNGRPIVNPGSIGCGKDGIVRFVTIGLDNGLANISYRQLRYDKEQVIRDYRKSAVPCGERFAAMFY